MAKNKNRSRKSNSSQIQNRTSQEVGRPSSLPERPSEITGSQIAVQQFSGPIPPPQVLAEYEQILPGSMDRILAMAESSQGHQQDVEKQLISFEGQALNASIHRSALGLKLAFVVTFSAIAGGVFLLSIGKDIAGYAALMTSLGTLVGLFIYGTKKKTPKPEDQPNQHADNNSQLKLPL